MLFTAEISHYPLEESYEETILSFIEILKSYPLLVIKTNSMSTQIKGDHLMVMEAIGKAISSTASDRLLTATVIKIIPRDLPIEAGYFEV